MTQPEFLQLYGFILAFCFIVGWVIGKICNRKIMKMKEIVLRINHLAFSWYYRSCGNHFKQWTFIRSVKILIQNYNHQHLLLKDSEEQKVNLIRDNDRLRKELFNIKINQCANMQEVGTVVKIFKGNINSVSDN